MRDMMFITLEGTLDQEIDEELGYSKYDYQNKETDHSRNVHSQKTMHTSYGDMEIDIPRDRNGEFESQIVKKYQNTVTQDMKEKIIFMYAAEMITNGCYQQREVIGLRLAILVSDTFVKEYDLNEETDSGEDLEWSIIS